MNWPVRGGSNLLWYASSPLPCYLGGTHSAAPDANHSPQGVDPFSVITNYDLRKTGIDAALSQMYANGQRRLRLILTHMRGGERAATPGVRMTNMDSTGAVFSPQCTQNLRAFLATIKAAGFAEVAVGMAPQWRNNPTYPAFNGQMWPAGWYFQEPYESFYQENWNLIVNLRPIFAAADLNIKIDLCNEGIPPSSFPGLLDYCKRLWNNYSSCFGVADTFGFSVAGPALKKNSNFDSVYQGVKPYVLDVHMYTPVAPDVGSEATAGDAKAEYLKLYDMLQSRGYDQGWIIGETWYNSPGTAEGFRQAMQEAGNTVYWMTQWAADSRYSYQNPPVLYGYRDHGW